MKQNNKNTTTPADNVTCNPQTPLEPTLNDPEWLASMDADLDPRSTLLAKLTAPERARVYEALVSHDPPTYRGVYNKFQLREKGISYTAFFNNARRIRLRAVYTAHTRLIPMGAPLFDDILPDLLGARLLEALSDETAKPRAIARLTNAYRSATTVGFTRRRLTADLKRMKSRTVSADIQELERIVGDHTRTRNAESKAEEAELLDIIARRKK